jgi:hypothetical protein
VKELQLVNIKRDLYQYLRNKHAIIAPEFCRVVAEANKFTEAVVRNGFEAAFVDSPAHVSVQSDRPFIELAEALVDHQTRFVRPDDLEIAQKSLVEAYIYIAGPRFVFEPTTKTRFVASLHRSEPRKFAALLFSLHIFNSICALIRDDLRVRIQDVKSFELYLLNVETICRDIVKEAVKIPGTQLDESWAKSVIRRIENQLLQPPVIPTKTEDLSVPTSFRK